MKEQSENKDLKKKFEDFTYPVGESNWDGISARLNAGSGQGFLGAKFSNYTAQPSSNVWSNISAVIQPSNQKRPVAWWWYAAAASVMLLVYLGYAVLNTADKPSQLAQKEVTVAKQTDENIPSDVDVIPLAKDSSNAVDVTQVSSLDSNTAGGNATKRIGTVVGGAAANESSALAENNEIINSEIDFNNESEKQANEPQDYLHKRNAAISQNKKSLGASANLLAKASPRNPEISGHHAQPVFAERPMAVDIAKVNPDQKVKADEKLKKSSDFYDGTETTSSQEFSLWAGSLMAFASSGAENNAERATFLFASPQNGLSNSVADVVSINFSPPLYYGVNGEIKIKNRLASGIGVGFLHMRSTSTQQFGTGQRITKQISDSYLSVPVYLKFNFIDKSKFAAYTSVGHAFDFMIGQNISTETFQNAQSIERTNTRNQQKGNQANFYGSLGMHVKVARQFGIFAEGSLMHYYSMSNSNFFSQQTYWPGLRFGLLVTFD